MDLSVKIAALASAALLAVAPAAATAASQTAVTAGLGYLTSQQQADGQIAGFPGINAWSLMAYSAAGQNNPALLNYIKSHAPAASAAATEWERNILAIVGAGENPYSFGGANYVAGLKATHTGGQIGSTSAVNDDAYGVLALVSANVPATDAALTDAVAFLLAHQLADGGFSYSAAAGATSDVDDTAAALAALYAAQSHGVANADLSGAITQARSYLLGRQNADGGFYSDPAWGTDSNVSSTAVTLIALNTVGLGEGTAAANAANYLKSTQQADGSFPYQLPVAPGQTGDTFDSAYAVAALAGGTWPLAVYEGPVPTVAGAPAATPAPTPTPGAGGTGAVLGASAATTLPAVGEFSNPLLLALAALIALGTGAGVYAARRRSRA